MIDLHMHSIYSDGSFTPAELVEEALRLKLKAIALTDHDSTKGVAHLRAAAEGKPLRVIPGVEISAEHSPGEMHILGYFIDTEHEGLEKELAWIREGRATRNQEIFEKLKDQGLNISWEEIAARAGSDVVGRPHFAEVLIAKGYAKHKKDAFNRYLAKGQSAYVGRRELKPELAIKTIRLAGGVPVLAHPKTLGYQDEQLRDCLAKLSSYGLGGIEIYYSEHRDAHIQSYLKLAKEFDLAPTGGTDFHGKMSPGISMGTGFGSLAVADELLDGLEAKIA